MKAVYHPENAVLVQPRETPKGQHRRPSPIYTGLRRVTVTLKNTMINGILTGRERAR